MLPYFLKDISGNKVPPIVLASPHSGRDYPQEFLDLVLPDRIELTRAEDRFVDELVMPAANRYDLPLIHARWGRTYLDLNRHPSELDPAILEGVAAYNSSARVKAGLGVLPRVATPGVPLYRTPLPVGTAHRRLREIHEPYYGKLGALLARARAANGLAVLIDCHSMPPLPRYAGRRGAQMVLGDRHGKTADPHIVGYIEDCLRRDFHTVRNAPYAGGYATAHFGAPNMGTHAVQLEIDRSLYLNPLTLRRGNGFDGIADKVCDLCGDLLANLTQRFSTFKTAAE